MWRTLAAGVAAAIALAAAPRAEACTCLEPSIEAAYFTKSDTFAARVIGVSITREEVRYRVRVLRTFGGCLLPGDVVFVRTARNEAACGQRLELGGRFLLTANETRDRGVYAIDLCGYNRALDALSEADRAFLEERMVVCDRTGAVTCADGSAPVACFADPCEVETCADAATCASNLCGGCDAEFYTVGFEPVCER